MFKGLTSWMGAMMIACLLVMPSEALAAEVSMSEAIVAVRNMLDARDLNYTFDESKNRFNATFNRSGSSLNKLTLAIIVYPSSKNPDRCIRITGASFVGFNAPENRRGDIAEYLHRATYGLPFGHFEMNYRDGEVLFKMSINTVDGLPGADAIDDLYAIPVLTMNRYADGLYEVSNGRLTPAEAVAKSEQSND